MAGRDDKPKRESRLGRFWHETVGELKRVSWPTRQQALRLTLITLVVMVAMGLFLFAIDNLAAILLSLAIPKA